MEGWVDTVGLDAEMVRKYVKYQDEQDEQDEQDKKHEPQNMKLIRFTCEILRG